MTEIHHCGQCSDPRCPRCLYALRTVEVFDLTAQVDDLREQLALNHDTLQRRTDAMHRVAQENDHLRSRLANQETTP